MLDENTKLTDCYYEKKDWRACKQEVSSRVLDGIAFLASEAEMWPSHRKQVGHFRLTHSSDGDVPTVLAETRQ